MKTETIETGINWDAVRKELDSMNWEECYDDPGREERRVFLGTVFALYPSGKYYMPWACSNLALCDDCGGKGCDECGGIGSREAYDDEQYREALEAEADAAGLFVTSGEGDPCDILAGECRDMGENAG